MARRYDLVKRAYLTLNLDLAQTGLGSNSCGPRALAQYELKPQPFRFAVTLTCNSDSGEVGGGRAGANGLIQVYLNA